MSNSKHPEDPAEGSREAVERELNRTGPEADAKGQSEQDHKGGTNDGVSSADPRVISEKEDGDATFPLDQDKRKGR